MSKIRPSQLEISTGSTDNDTINTLGYFNDINIIENAYTINNQTGTSYTITESDFHSVIFLTNTSDIILKVPQNSTENLSTGFNCIIVRGGTGNVTILPEGTDILITNTGRFMLNNTYSAVKIVKKSSGNWYAWGDFKTFLPTSVSGCIAWLDIMDNNTLTYNGSTISQIEDKSGNGNDYNQITSTNQPIYLSSGIGSKPSIQFDGTRYMSATDYLPTGNQNYSIFAVTRATQSASSILISFGATASTNRNLFIRHQVNDVMNTGWYNNNLASSSNAWITNNDVAIMSIYDNTVGRSQYVNNVAAGNDSQTSFNLSSGAQQIGASLGTPFFVGLMSELIVFNRPLTAPERSSLNEYVFERWNISA